MNVLNYTVARGDAPGYIDPYWHFEHGYHDGYGAKDDVRLYPIGVRGVHVNNLPEDKRNVDVRFPGRLLDQQPRVFVYDGPIEEAIKAESGWTEKPAFVQVSAKEGDALTLGIDLTHVDTSTLTVVVDHNTSCNSSGTSQRRIAIKRAPIYRYEGTFPFGKASPIYGIDNWGRAAITTRRGPYRISAKAEFLDKFVPSMWYAYQLVQLATSVAGVVATTIPNLLKGGVTAAKETSGFFVTEILPTGAQIVVESTRDAERLNAIEDADRKMRNPFFSLLPESVAEGFGGDWLYFELHLWELHRYEWPFAGSTYAKQDTIHIVACTAGPGHDGNYTPVITRWKPVDAATYEELNSKLLAQYLPELVAEKAQSLFSRIKFDNQWLAPYHYHMLPLPGSSLTQYSSYSSSFSDGVGLWFPRLEGLESQPNLVGLHPKK